MTGGVNLTTFLDLMLKVKKEGAVPRLLHTPLWRRAWLVKDKDIIV
jgi:hypothetical protein